MKHKFVVTIRNIANLDEISNSRYRRGKQILDSCKVKPVDTSICRHSPMVPYYWIACQNAVDCRTLAASKFDFLKPLPGRELDVRQSSRSSNCVFLRGIDIALSASDVLDIMLKAGVDVEGDASIECFKNRPNVPYCAIVGLKSEADVEKAIQIGEFRDISELTSFTCIRSERRTNPAPPHAPQSVRAAGEHGEHEIKSDSAPPKHSVADASHSCAPKPQPDRQQSNLPGSPRSTSADIRAIVRSEIAAAEKGRLEALTSLRSDLSSTCQALTNRMGAIEDTLRLLESRHDQHNVSPEAVVSARPYQELRSQIAQVRNQISNMEIKVVALTNKPSPNSQTFSAMGSISSSNPPTSTTHRGTVRQPPPPPPEALLPRPVPTRRLPPAPPLAAVSGELFVPFSTASSSSMVSAQSAAQRLFPHGLANEVTMQTFSSRPSVDCASTTPQAPTSNDASARTHQQDPWATYVFKTDFPAHAALAFTDGACPGNKGYGGAATVMQLASPPLDVNKIDSFGNEFKTFTLTRSQNIAKDATNNIAELKAVLQAFELISECFLAELIVAGQEVRIITDSKYVHGLLEKGNRANKNKDLVQMARTELSNRRIFNPTKVFWVPARSGIPHNVEADRLARAAARGDVIWTPVRNTPITLPAAIKASLVAHTPSPRVLIPPTKVKSPDADSTPMQSRNESTHSALVEHTDPTSAKVAHTQASVAGSGAVATVCSDLKLDNAPSTASCRSETTSEASADNDMSDTPDANDLKFDRVTDAAETGALQDYRTHQRAKRQHSPVRTHEESGDDSDGDGNQRMSGVDDGSVPPAHSPPRKRSKRRSSLRNNKSTSATCAEPISSRTRFHQSRRQ